MLCAIHDLVETETGLANASAKGVGAAMFGLGYIQNGSDYRFHHQHAGGMFEGVSQEVSREEVFVLA